MAKWTTNQILELTKFLTRKNQSGSISANDLFYAWNSEQSAYHQDIVGRWQNRSNGKSGINTGLILNETILTQLAIFTINETITVTNGEATKPEDLVYALALRKDGKNIDVLQPGQVFSMLDSVIDPASETTGTYYSVMYENYYKIYPDTVTQIELDYVAETTDIIWGYDFDAQGRQVYNSATSVNPKWSNNNTIIEITKRTLKGFGVSFKDSEFSNYGNSVIQTGD